MKLTTRVSRGTEVVWKAGHAGLREIRMAPEQRAARVLGLSVERALASVAPAGRRVLFLTPRSWASHVQWEAVLGQALRLRGAEVSYLTCAGGLGICDRNNTREAPSPPCRSCSKYVDDALAAHGLDHAPLSQDWEPGTGEQAWPELDALGIDELADVEHGGLPLGKLVEIPVKWFLLRSDLRGDPLAALTYRRFLRSARAIAAAVEAELDRREREGERPDVAVLCNGLFLFEAIAAELCRRRGIDVVTYERGLIKETLIFRLNAPACLMDIDPAWEAWKDHALTPEEDAQLDSYLDERRHGQRTIDRYWDDVVFETGERAPERRQVVLLPNLTWDSAVIGRAASYDGLENWIVDTIDAVAARGDVDLVIRIHPAETKLPGKQTREPVGDLIARNFPDGLPSCVRIVGSDDPTSSYSIIEESDLVVVFSSTTGLEATLMGKPVVVAGETHYRGKGFTRDAVDPADYLAAIDEQLSAPVPPERIETARRYAHLLFFRAPVACPGAEEHVLGLARLTVHDAAALRPGADPSIDRICAGIMESTEFHPC